MPDISNAVTSESRLAAVASTNLLDTAADEAFDRFAALAARLLEAPYAFVTLVDDKRSFWKACIGIETEDLSARQNPVEESFCQYVVGSREPLIVGDTRMNSLTRDNPSILSMGVLAWAGFPVFSPDGEVLGSFCVVDTKVREWTARDVDVLSVLSLAVASEYALRISLATSRDAERVAHSLATTLQHSLLPPVPPTVPGLDVAACYRPAGRGQEVVGDFYDVFRLNGRSNWAVTIGDVSGKGVEAAKVTALARHTIRAAGMLGGSPSDVLAALNAAMLAQTPPGSDDEPRFLTATYAHLRLSASEVVVRLANAGHCPSLVRRSDGSIETIEMPGQPLGWFRNLEVAERRLVLRRGDSLILHTDGVTEARREGEMFGDGRLLATIDRAPLGTDAATLAALIDSAASGFEGAEPADDTAILVVSVPSSDGDVTR